MSKISDTERKEQGYDPLSFITKFSYGCGDFACQLTMTLVNSYLLIFYTDVVGLTPFVISMIMLIARIWDAVNDPMLGAVAERTRSRWGRFRPYILFGAPFLAVTAVLTFMSPDFGTSGKNWWALITYILWGMAFTVVNIPYGSLSSVMTKSAVERNKLNSFRMLGTNLAGMLLSGAVLPIVAYFGRGNDEEGYFFAALIFSLVSIPLLMLLFFNSKEVIDSQKHQKMPLKVSLTGVIRNRNMLLVVGFLVFYMIGFYGRMGVVIYYLMYSVARWEFISVLMMLPACGAVIGILLSSKLLEKMGRKIMIMIASFGSGLALIILYFVPLTNIGLIYVFTFVYGLFQFSAPLAFTLAADTIDYGEDRFGYRIDGVAFGIISFATKIANTIAGTAGIAAITWVGYIANTNQTETVKTGISAVVNLGCGAIFLLSGLIISFYKLTDAECLEIRARLDKKSVAAETQE